MSLPGLGLAEPEEPQSTEAVEHQLRKGSEWRFEVAFAKYVHVKLLNGTAEVFGTEIVIGRTYVFTGTKAAVYTWHGCTLEVSGDMCQSEYTAEETPMNEYANVHFALETLRNEAKSRGRQGPRVLILGPGNAGKTSLAKLLVGYSIQIGKQPVLVNLDSREGVMSLPGTLTATAFKTLMDIEEGWGSSPMSGPSAVPVKLPLVYYYGLPHPEDKDGWLYKALVSKLALAVSGRLQEDVDAKETGLIIDTPGSLTSTKSSSGGYDIVNHIVSEFSVSAIIVLGSERLYSDMVKRFDRMPTSSSSSTGETISVVKLAKSGGCVDRDEAFMRLFRAAQIRSYFYGNGRLSNGVDLSPRQQQVDFSHLSIYRLIGAGGATSQLGGASSFPLDLEFLPGGGDDEGFDTPANGGDWKNGQQGPLFERMTKLTPAMQNCVLAIMNADADADEDDIRDSSVMGFVYVVDVDEAKSRISLLAPVAGRIPSRAIVWAGWPEEVIGMV